MDLNCASFLHWLMFTSKQFAAQLLISYHKYKCFHILQIIFEIPNLLHLLFNTVFLTQKILLKGSNRRDFMDVWP